MRTEDIDHTDVRKLWPVADLEPFAAFAWEERGGYGDAYQTAQAFAGAARRAGARLRQGTTATAIRTSGDRVTGVELADGTAIATEHVVLAAGPWSVGLLAAHGIELPITPHREQIVLVDPGQDLGPVPVFSDLVSLQYIRPEGAGTLLFGNSDLSILEPADPDRYSNQATSSFVDLTVEKVGDRLPGLAEPGDRRELRRLLRRHARLQPGHLGGPAGRARRRRRLLGARLQDLAGRRAARRRPRRRRHELRRRHPRPGLPALPLRRGRPAPEPPPLRRRRPDALRTETRDGPHDP